MDDSFLDTLKEIDRGFANEELDERTDQRLERQLIELTDGRGVLSRRYVRRRRWLIAATLLGLALVGYGVAVRFF